MKQALCFLMLFFVSVSASAETIQGRVVAVSDGDTMTVFTNDRKQMRVEKETIGVAIGEWWNSLNKKEVLILIGALIGLGISLSFIVIMILLYIFLGRFAVFIRFFGWVRDRLAALVKLNRR